EVADEDVLGSGARAHHQALGGTACGRSDLDDDGSTIRGERPANRVGERLTQRWPVLAVDEFEDIVAIACEARNPGFDYSVVEEYPRCDAARQPARGVIPVGDEGRIDAPISGERVHVRDETEVAPCVGVVRVPGRARAGRCAILRAEHPQALLASALYTDSDFGSGQVPETDPAEGSPGHTA